MNPWNVVNSTPKDGKPYICIGQIQGPSNGATVVYPFCRAIFWHKESGEWCDWLGSRLTIRDDPEDRVSIFGWIDFPMGFNESNPKKST